MDVAVFGAGYLLGWFPSVQSFADAIYHDPTWVMLPGRVAMALFGAGCVWLTYSLAAALFDRRVGLAAAAFLALNPVHIHYSQLIRTDIMATFFMLLAMLSAVRIARDGRWRDHVLASLWIGLAVATKWPFAIASLAVAGAALLRFVRQPQQRINIIVCAASVPALSLAVLLLVSPYLLLDYPTVLRNLQGEDQLHLLGATGGTVLENAWFYLTGPLLRSQGWAGTLLVVAGVPVLLRRREALAVCLPIVIAFFIVFSNQRLVWERWALPLMPILAIAAGLGFVRLTTFLRSRLGPRLALGASALAALAVALPLLIDTNAAARIAMTDTRQIATRWAATRIPAGSTIMVEHFGFDLLRHPWEMVFPLGEAGCVNARALLHGKVQYASIDSGRNGRSNVDYGTLSVAKRATCRTDYAILTQADRYAAERQWFPREDAAYRELLAHGTVLATITPVPGQVGGPIVRIVQLKR
jgi:hypothetical protein